MRRGSAERLCERGIRLNFIDTQTSSAQPLTSLPPGTQLVFHDESQAIASGYTVKSHDVNGKHVDVNHASSRAESATQTGVNPGESGPLVSTSGGSSAEEDTVTVSPQLALPSLYLITDHEESLLMEIFVTKVGPGLDCLVASKLFTNITPFYALDHPVLYSAIMACGERYLVPTGESMHYEKACEGLELELENPNRDQLVCLTASTLLQAYTTMGNRPNQSGVDRARAQTDKAEVDINDSGLAAACFLVKHSHVCARKSHRRHTTDLGFNKTHSHEDQWVRRMVSICASIAALNADFVVYTDKTDPDSSEGLLRRCEQYKTWCDDWAGNVPRSMMPLCYVPPDPSAQAPSHFPQIFLIKPSASVARLLYHASCLMLDRIQAASPTADAHEVQLRQTRHASDICGIASQAEDREFVYVATCCLSFAARFLVEPEANEEAFHILDRITHGTPWRPKRFRQGADCASRK
ncbi:hypothetical protein PG997_009040 [Apiospora hydei]|uniref:Uncharacterized protein n=1 Tax=Apiospora hydei TaxID=1337664 RepID=A0ABR1VU75_9PEZI